MVKMSTRYIEVVGGIGIYTCYLVDTDLESIGEFTRENVLRWLENTPGPAVEMYPIQDFHVVCNDIDIPWATEEARDFYQRIHRVKKLSEA